MLFTRDPKNLVVFGSTKVIKKISAITLLLFVALIRTLPAATAPPLGTATSFAVLAGSTVTNTGPTVVNGDLGVSPGSAITGFPPGVVVGTIHAGDATAIQAQSDVTTAYNALAGQACNTVLTGVDLGGLTLIPGVYCFAAGAQLTGTLTLDAQGNPNAVFVFQIGSTLITASNSAVNIINGGLVCNVFFQVGSSATLGTNTAFKGNILALASITANAGASVSGRLLARTAAVTLDTNAVAASSCGTLQVCKVAGLGVVVGTPFAFNVAGTPVTVAAGVGPGGTCSTPQSATAGPATITETIPPGVTLTSVTTQPPGLLVSSNLATGSATVTVIAGGQTTAIFTDTAAALTGTLQVCKVAGLGVVVGTPFAFNVAGTPVIVGAGVGPGGTCSAPQSAPAGPAVVTETIPAGVVLTSVTTQPPGALVSSNLATGTATVTVITGALTTVIFTDAAAPGTLQVCKVAGLGVVVGTPFAFNVAGTPVLVPAGVGPGGTCSAPQVAPVGPAVITETIPAGVVLTSVTTQPPGALVSSNLAAGTATVTVVAGSLTTAIFTDTAIALTGLLQVCKVAGMGVAIGTNFSFNVAGTPVVVAAGAGPGGTCSIPQVAAVGLAAITETIPPGFTLLSVTTQPPGALVSSNLATGMATVTVVAGALTTAIFTDGACVTVPDAFQVRYATNLNIGDSFVDVTNTGASSTTAFPTQNGNICVNVYTFSPDEQLISCCSCPVTPNAVASFSALNDLIGNTLTPGVPTSIVIKLVATAGNGAGGACNAGTAGTGTNLPTSGLAAWGTTLHALPVTPGTPAITYGTTETPFIKGTLCLAEFTRIQTLCSFIQTNGSGFGICRACRLGGLGGSRTGF